MNPKEIEEKILKKWEEEKTYEKVKNIGEKNFYFCDGPPYASGFLHMGHTLNYSLKDAWLRIYRLRNYKVFDRQGYDTHGTPIEVKVEKSLNFNSKKDIESFGVKNFILKCKEFATKNISKQREQLKNIGVWMDLDKPYLTLSDEFIEAVWWVFKKAEEKNLLYKGIYPVHICPRCETVVAYNEIEYKKIKDKSIYLLVKIKNKEEYLCIWTTTPWTLPANTGIMVNPNLKYVKLKYNDKIIIVAKELAYKFKNSEIIEEFDGKKLVWLEYEPIIGDQKELKVVPSEKYVSAEEGTGLVHCAPGHGKEDFEVGKENGLKILCPISVDGVFTETKYKGLYVFDSNEKIIEDLKNNILKEEEIIHDYPTCWRCHTKLIILTISEYFFAATKIRDTLLEENKKVNWTPNWAKDRFKDWLISINDWPVSRQRYWGTPIPIWECQNCHKIEVIGSKKELEEKSGREVKDMHRPEIDEIELPCVCGNTKKRVPDVFDVWLDSGVATWANLGYPKSKELFEKLWPADLEIEGSDQIRGWWNSQLILSVIGFGKAPYKNIIYHGLILDNAGRKMSKSIGNVIMPEEVISKYGRDTLRLTLLSEVPWKDIYFSWDLVKQSYNKLNTLFNLFTYYNAYKITNSQEIELKLEDKYLISKLNSVIKLAYTYLEKKELHNYINLLFSYIVDDLSRTYIKLIRDRISTDITVSKVLNKILLKLNILISPVVPFIAEYLYFGDKESIFFERLPEIDEDKIDKELEQKFTKAKEISEAFNAERQIKGVKLRFPIKKGIVYGTEKIKSVVEECKEIICRLSNLKELEFKKLENIEIKPNYARIGKKFTSKTKEVAKLIENLKLEEITDEKIKIGDFEIEREDLVIRQKEVSGSDFSEGYVEVDTSEDENLKQER
ncbi:MAG: isoleucine--tRNA ligase, partial [Candidatus Aenigmarchaeota archaeon ex4484_56]